MSVSISSAAAGMPAIYQSGRDESVRIVLENAAERIDRAADLFGVSGTVKAKTYATRFAEARDALDEGARLVGVVRSAEPARARGAMDEALAAIVAWREQAVSAIDYAATYDKMHRVTPAADRDGVRAVAGQVRDLAPVLSGASAETALLDEAARLAEPATSGASSGRRGAALLGAAKLGGAGAAGAGVLELAQAALRFI